MPANRSPHFKRKRTIPDLIAEGRQPRVKEDTAWFRFGASEYLGIGFTNSWGNVNNASLNFAPLRFYLSEDGEVRLHGAIAGGAIGTVVCNLPPEARPQFAETFICPLTDGTGHATVRVEVNGDIKVVNILEM